LAISAAPDVVGEKAHNAIAAPVTHADAKRKTACKWDWNPIKGGPLTNLVWEASYPTNQIPASQRQVIASPASSDWI
jgi:hypothetical protein